MTMRSLFVLVLTLFAVPLLHAQDNMRPILFDHEDPPEWYPQENPFNTLALLVAWETPILDHSGKPHKHGRVIQVIMDGGNGVQDPPKADGSPGGDDSLAYGNFNMIRVMGIDDPPVPTGASGMFYSKKYFIPYFKNRPVYLRFWEGEDERIAPYYQDSIEYKSDEDQGGAMVMLKDGIPVDLIWSFGDSKPRPKKS